MTVSLAISWLLMHVVWGQECFKSSQLISGPVGFLPPAKREASTVSCTAPGFTHVRTCANSDTQKHAVGTLMQ